MIFFIETVQEHKDIDEVSIRRVHEKTISRTYAKLGLLEKNAELTTIARHNACSDQLNFVAMAVGLFLIVRLVHPFLIINQDATQFEVGHASRPVKIVVVKGSKGPRKVLPEKGDTGLVAFFIKFFVLISAGGYHGDGVYVIGDPRMTKGAFKQYKVKGIGITVDPNGYGWIVFCNTRSPPVAFFKWYAMYVVVDFIDKLKVFSLLV